jgi:hypothetical protein
MVVWLLAELTSGFNIWVPILAEMLAGLTELTVML